MFPCYLSAVAYFCIIHTYAECWETHLYTVHHLVLSSYMILQLMLVINAICRMFFNRIAYARHTYILTVTFRTGFRALEQSVVALWLSLAFFRPRKECEVRAEERRVKSDFRRSNCTAPLFCCSPLSPRHLSLLPGMAKGCFLTVTVRQL